MAYRRHVMVALLVLAVPVISTPSRAATIATEAHDGIVLEDGVETPIADALVYVRWIGVAPIFHSSHTPCYHQAVAKTDAEGRFHIAPWSRPVTPSDQRWLSGVEPHGLKISVFKPGFVHQVPRPSRSDNRVIRLSRAATASDEVRFLYDMGVDTFCDTEPQKNILGFLGAIADRIDPLLEQEWSRLSEWERAKADGPRVTYERNLLDGEEAHRRSAARRMDRKKRL